MMNKAIRILFVEDSENDARLILRHLQKGGIEVLQYRRVETEEGLAGALREQEWDLLICDYHLPRFDAPRALAVFRESGLDIPVIVISGEVGEDIAVNLMKSGAHDYLLKDKLARLVPAVHRELREAAGRRDRQRAEMAVREQARLLDLAHDAIIVCDLDGRVQYWNHGAERLYGWRAAEIIGQDKRLPDTQFSAAKEELLVRGEWQEISSQISKTGTGITVSRSWSLVLDEENRPKSILVIDTDITEHKKLEEQLLHAQKMEAIGRLAGGVAHDFNNLLTVILGFSQLLLQKDNLDPPAVNNLKQIVQAAEMAGNLTRQLLAFSRKHAWQPVNLDPGELIRNLARMLQRIIGEDIILKIDANSALPAIYADAGMIEQVVFNLAINSRDAMPAGGTLELTTRQARFQAGDLPAGSLRRAGEFVCLCVRDTGCGIPPEIRNRLFEPFFTTKEPGKGTGLGLATVYGIIQQHQGWVEVESRVNAGTAFFIFLPAVSSNHISAPVAETPQAICGGQETILLVEDEPLLRLMAREYLSSLGYTILEADSGPAAQSICSRAEQQIHLLLTDILLPEGVTGTELAMRLIQSRPGLKVVYCSGWARNTLNCTPGIPPDGFYIQKPFSARELAMTVRQALDQRG